MPVNRQKGCLIWESFDWKESAQALFDRIKDRPNVFFLDSSLRDSALGRYSFLGCEPFYVFKGYGKEAVKELRSLFDKFKLSVPEINFPFSSGAVGYFSYDWGLRLENIESRKNGDFPLAEVFLGFYDVIIAIDHWQDKLFIFSSGLPERNYLLAKKKAGERIKKYIRELSLSGINPALPGIARGRFSSDDISISPNLKRIEYIKAINKAKEYIRKGDIYQVNLSRRFCARSFLDAPGLYQRLRRISPSAFSAFLDCGEFQIISSSPERFLSCHSRKVIARPMKGTRPRGRNRQEDKSNKNDLLNSVKDKAELLMIVDLMRNDLGRVCEYGSIKTISLRNLEKYSTVYQTTATIEGRLHKEKDCLDLLKACFPGGSITGCPKIRSMQIIEELEPARRGVYTGSLGYIGFNNNMDLNILIRTIIKKDDKIYFQSGGGIVADSSPQSEYRETLIKAKAMLEALGANRKYEDFFKR